jgi:hypothetical protein
MEFEINMWEQPLRDIRGNRFPDVQYIEQWDYYGIVNTASMLWPNGKKTRLVHGDHGDIIGHYKLVHTNEEVSAHREHKASPA